MEFDVSSHGLEDRLRLPPYNARRLNAVLESIYLTGITVGCLLGGSRTIGNASDKSDVDLFFHCSSDVLSEDITMCMSRIADLPCVYGLVDQGRLPWFGQCFAVVFSDWCFSLDIGFVSDINAWDFFWEPTGIILWDKKGLVTQRVSYWKENFQLYPFRSKEPFVRGFMALFKAIKSLEKGEIFNAIELCGQARRSLIILLRSQIGGAADFYYGRAERRIETLVDKYTLERLHQTLPTHNPESIFLCIKRIGKWIVEIGDTQKALLHNEKESHKFLTELLPKVDEFFYELSNKECGLY